ncbi:DUF4365 domain-containing protein [Acrocarpospora corrugata]|uniref:DUF4365 domain-containing protein n=1 Tax=Acrocarpospora corrugata TaxID=35763 RepID=UPI001FE44735|nr:DUF4365 domain-containing protein [Acrocarpospora corrugata]
MIELPADEITQLPLNAMKEQFSLSFVHMVASAAGCSIKSHATDYDGVDITVSSSAEYATYYCPEFELQLKATSQHDLLKPEHLSWTMTADRFRKLTNPKRFVPAYLGVLLLPEGDWLDQDERRLLTDSRMYWQSAADLGSIDAGASAKTVRLPRSNLFDVPQLRGIMKTIGEGGEW